MTEEEKLEIMTKQILKEITKTKNVEDTILLAFKAMDKRIPGFLDILVRFASIFTEFLIEDDFTNFVRSTMDLIAFIDENLKRKGSS